MPAYLQTGKQKKVHKQLIVLYFIILHKIKGHKEKLAAFPLSLNYFSRCCWETSWQETFINFFAMQIRLNFTSLNAKKNS